MTVPAAKKVSGISDRVLLIAQDPTSAHRYTRSEASEINVVLTDRSGEIEVPQEQYARVVIAACAAGPDALRRLVDTSFGLVMDGGDVLIGAAAGAENTTPEKWRLAFRGIVAAGWGDEPFPAVRVARSEGDEGAGAFLHGVLTALDAPQLRVSIEPTPRVEPTPPVEATRTDSLPPAPNSTPATKSSSGRSSVRGTLLARRPQLLIAAAGMVLAVAVAFILVAIFEEFFLAAVGTAILIVLFGHALRAEQQNRRILAASREQREQLRSLRSKLGPEHLSQKIADQGEELQTLRKSSRITELAVVDSARLLHRMDACFKDAQLPGLQGHIDRSSRRSFEQVQATINLFGLVDVNSPVPPMRGWAASPDALNILVQEFLVGRSRQVVECGSGISTLWLALTAKKFGIVTRIVALDHDAEFAKRTNQLLARHGVDDIASARLAPLAEVTTDRGAQLWYEPSALDDLEDIGLVFVDGPPAATGPLARYPALPLLWDKLAGDASIVLDDTIRQDELDIIAQWATTHPDLSVESFDTEKGTHVLRRA